jgi:hypothetical protein
VGDHPAVGEDPRRRAGGVDEGLVEPAVGVQPADQVEVARAGRGVPFAELRQRHRPAGLRELERLVVHRRQPHLELPDHPVELPADRQRPLVDALDRELDRAVQCFVVEPCGAVDHLADQPDVVLDHLDQDVHPSDLSAGRQAQACRRVEVDPARRVQEEPVGGPAAPLARRHAVRATEGAGERLVRPEAGVDGDVQHAVRAADQPVRRTLQQHPAPERGRRLTGDGGHHPVEVEAGQVSPAGEVGAVRVRLVEAAGDHVHEGGEHIRRTHGIHSGPPPSRDT